MSELGDIEIESVQSLKYYIKKEIKDDPVSFLSKTNFSNLSPAIMDTIYELFSKRPLSLHESQRLNRIIEYGEALKKSPEHSDKEIKEIVAPLMKYLDLMEMTEAGFHKLIKYSLLPYEEICNYTLEIMKENSINVREKPRKLEFSKFTLEGSMMDRLNINPNSDLKKWRRLGA